MSKQHSIHNDDRYSIQQEHTGAAKPQWVARFCGEWIGASQFYGSALVQAVSHNARRNGALILAAEV